MGIFDPDQLYKQIKKLEESVTLTAKASLGMLEEVRTLIDKVNKLEHRLDQLEEKTRY